MNGYELLAESYQSLAKKGLIPQEDADKKIRIFDFLSSCDNNDLYAMVDSSAFNDIIRAYIKLAVDSAEVIKKYEQ